MAVGAAVLAGSVISGISSSKSASAQSRAAQRGIDAQAEATRYAQDIQRKNFLQALAEQQRQFDINQQSLEPYRQSGRQALTVLNNAPAYSSYGVRYPTATATTTQPANYMRAQPGMTYDPYRPSASSQATGGDILQGQLPSNYDPQKAKILNPQSQETDPVTAWINAGRAAQIPGNQKLMAYYANRGMPIPESDLRQIRGETQAPQTQQTDQAAPLPRPSEAPRWTPPNTTYEYNPGTQNFNVLAPPSDTNYAERPEAAGPNIDYASYEGSPAYRFQLEEGQKALERSAAGRGGLLSGRAAKEALRYSQGLASQDFENYANRKQAEYNNQFIRGQTLYGRTQDELNRRAQEYGDFWNRNAALAGVGQTATNAGVNVGQNYAANLGNLYTNQGNVMAGLATNLGGAQAAGYGAMGAAKAGQYQGWNNAIQSGISNYLLGGYLGSFGGGNTP